MGVADAAPKVLLRGLQTNGRLPCCQYDQHPTPPAETLREAASRSFYMQSLGTGTAAVCWPSPCCCCCRGSGFGPASGLHAVCEDAFSRRPTTSLAHSVQAVTADACLRFTPSPPTHFCSCVQCHDGDSPGALFRSFLGNFLIRIAECQKVWSGPAKGKNAGRSVERLQNFKLKRCFDEGFG